MHVVESGALECEVASNQCSCRDKVEVGEAGRISRALHRIDISSGPYVTSLSQKSTYSEHVKHALRDDESSCQTDC